MRVGVRIAAPSFLFLSNGAGDAPLQPGFGDDLAHQREAVGVHARRSDAEDDVARADVVSRQHGVALDGADREARQIVVVAVIDAGHFRGLAADQRAAGLLAAFGDARDDCGAHLRVELPRREVVQKKQRLGALHHEIVHRHRHEVDADCVVNAGVDRDLDLGSDAVVRGDQHRILEARALEIEQSAEAADLGVGARPRSRLHQRLDQVHHAVARVDIDAGLRIGQALFAHASAYVGIRLRAMARTPIYSGEIAICAGWGPVGAGWWPAGD